MKYKWKDYSQSFNGTPANNASSNTPADGEGSNTPISPPTSPTAVQRPARKNSLPSARYSPLRETRRNSASYTSPPLSPTTPGRLDGDYIKILLEARHSITPDLAKSISQLIPPNSASTPIIIEDDGEKDTQQQSLTSAVNNLHLSEEESATLLQQTHSPQQSPKVLFRGYAQPTATSPPQPARVSPRVSPLNRRRYDVPNHSSTAAIHPLHQVHYHPPPKVPIPNIPNIPTVIQMKDISVPIPTIQTIQTKDVPMKDLPMNITESADQAGGEEAGGRVVPSIRFLLETVPQPL